jgi:hypothetical protein
MVAGEKLSSKVVSEKYGSVSGPSSSIPPSNAVSGRSRGSYVSRTCGSSGVNCEEASAWPQPAMMASVSGVEEYFGKRPVLSSEVAEVSYLPFSQLELPKVDVWLTGATPLRAGGFAVIESFGKSRRKKSTVLFASFSKEAETCWTALAKKPFTKANIFKAASKTEKVLEGPGHGLDRGRRIIDDFLDETEEIRYR